MKDREAPELRSSEKLLKSHVITRCFYLQNKVVEFNFSRNIMQTEYMAQVPRFVYMNAIAFKCIFSLYD